MVQVTYANGRQQLPFASSNLVVSTGGSQTQSLNLYFAVQGHNPAGSNLLSTQNNVAIAPGQQLAITIDPTMWLAGEWWTSFVVSASTSTDPTTFVQLAKVPAYTSGQPVSLPQTIYLSSDEHFAMSKTVANPAALPSASAVLHGALRGVTSLNAVFAYDAFSAATVDNIYVLAATTGRWILQGVSFNTYVSSVSAIATADQNGGCAQDVNSINTSNIVLPTYAVDGTVGRSQKFWIVNDSSVGIPAGTRVGVTILVNNEPKTILFNQLIRVIFRGYANTSDGTLRTTDTSSNPLYLLDQDVGVQARKSNLITSDTLNSGEAMVLEFYPQFSAYELSQLVPAGSVIALFPFFYPQSGEYSEAGAPLGNMIYNSGSFRIIVPQLALSALALDGGGMVQSISFLDSDPTPLVGFLANTADQVVTVNGNGAVFLLKTTLSQQQQINSLIGTQNLGATLISLGILDATEDVRAFVGTVNGTGYPSPVYKMQANGGLTVSVVCAYPCAGSGLGTIRADYPDSRLAGNAQGLFNPTGVVIYAQNSAGQIRQFTGFVVAPGTSQAFNLPNWASGTIISSIPSPVDPSYGLFDPGAVALSEVSGSTDWLPDTYKIQIAFTYTNTITSISHSESLGCILTLDDITLASLIVGWRANQIVTDDSVITSLIYG